MDDLIRVRHLSLVRVSRLLISYPYSSLNLYSDFQVHDILDIIKSKDIAIPTLVLHQLMRWRN